MTGDIFILKSGEITINTLVCVTGNLVVKISSWLDKLLSALVRTLRIMANALGRCGDQLRCPIHSAGSKNIWCLFFSSASRMQISVGTPEVK